jgi:signal transduction histidine kinase
MKAPLWVFTLLACACLDGLADARTTGEIVVERVAGWSSPAFRHDQARLRAIERELAGLPELAPRPLAWRYGFRSGTQTDPEEAQWLQIDLDGHHRIDRIAIVPAHIAPLGKPGEGYGFPRRFKIEAGDDPEMKNAVVVVDQTAADFPHPGRYPVDFRVQPVTARYVRFTSTRHFPIDEGFIWAIEELLVLSGNRSLANWRRVTASSSLEMFPNWSMSRAQDGQSSLGLPVTTEPSPSLGYLSTLSNDPDEPKWLHVDLEDEYPIDEIRLVPVQSGGYEALGERSFPRAWNMELAEDPQFERIVWRYEKSPTNLVGYPGDCAVILHSNGSRGRHLRLVTLKHWGADDQCGYGLAEIQAYSGDENVALGKPVMASDKAISDSVWAPAFVTDGFSSRHRLIELPDYLDLISRRKILERERALLVARHDRKLHVTGLALGYGGGALGAAGVLGSLWLLIRQRQLRRQSVVMLREQIARDLHDDIGSNLGGIVLLSEIGGRQSADPQSRTDFQAIKQAADEAAESMRDIVWLIHRGGYGLRELVARMRQSSQVMLGDKELAMEVEPADFRDRKLSLLFRRHVFFAFKETLNNARKHARAARIEVRIRVDSSRLVFTVRDDGIGFDPQACNLTGIGLGNLQRRAARLKGSCHIESRPGHGSVVTFSAPLKS